MNERKVSGMILILLLTNVLFVMLDAPVVLASGTIYIRADGSIDPPTAPIQRDGDFEMQSDVDWWPMFHHDLRHTGYSTSEAPDTNSTIWNYATGGYIESSPAVVDDRVYIGSADGNVYCINAKDGTKIWNYSTGNPYVFSSPAVVGHRVYVGSLNGTFYCLNTTNGAKIWSYDTGGSTHSPPAVADGKVFVGSWDGNVYAFGPVHDVTISDVTPSKTVVGQGYSLNINVTAANQGDYTETFNVIAYADLVLPIGDEITIGTQTISNLLVGETRTVTFPWNTTGFAKGNYTISAYAETIPGETDTGDNTFTDGTVKIGVPCDLNGDNKCNLLDLVKEAGKFGAEKGNPHSPPAPKYDLNYDFNDDNKINLLDLVKVAIHFGETDP
jgi:hypothetical protein